MLKEARIGIVDAAGGLDEDLVARAQKGDTEAFNALVTKHKETLDRKVGVFRSAPIPQSVLRANAVSITRQAVDRFKTGTGATFKTHLENNLRGLSRRVNQTKNVARIPEHRFLAIKRYTAAKEILQADKGREPTTVELAESLGWAVAEVEKMERSVNQRALAASSMEFVQGDAQAALASRIQENFDFAYYSLSPDEQLVFDYSMGTRGKPKLKTVKDIARRTGLTSDRVYALKREIARKLQQVR